MNIGKRREEEQKRRGKMGWKRRTGEEIREERRIEEEGRV